MNERPFEWEMLAEKTPEKEAVVKPLPYYWQINYGGGAMAQWLKTL